MENKRHLGDVLKARRQELDLTAEQLAVRVGITAQTVNRLERIGKMPKNRFTCQRLLRALKLDRGAVTPPAVEVAE